MQSTHRRTRIPLSCEPCRTRKLKCNRDKPCQNCIARAQQDTCNYRGDKDATVPASRRRGDDTAMRQRIDHLERLVKQLASDRTSISSSEGDRTTSKSAESRTGQQTPDGVAETLAPDPIGQTVLDSTHSVYHGGNDWHVVLQEISELKSSLVHEQDCDVDLMFDHLQSPTADGSSLLFTQPAPTERLEILSTLPPRSEVSRLVSWFFDSKRFPVTIPPILHEPTFRRELDNHWKDPSQTDLIWLGLIFSILGITMLAYHMHGESPEYEGRSESLFQLYRTRTGQCLQRGDIAKCLPYTVETLRLNSTAELNRKDDNRRTLWMTTGVIVRAAVNMGYHRDPSHSTHMSIVEAEYRRRVWLSVVSMDNIASFQIDFPRMVPKTYSDTKEPLNVHDWELLEDMTALPTGRPLSELTPVTYLIAKSRLYKALGQITDLNSSPQLSSYENVLEADRALQREFEDLQPFIKAALANDDSAAPKTATSPTFSLLYGYYLGMCNLHRRFMARARENTRFSLSRERCVSCSVSLLTFQHGLDPKFYKMSRTRQTFALAAMLLFLELEIRKKETKHEASPESSHLLNILENSANSWAEAMHVCEETWSIYQLLVRMLAACHAWQNKPLDPPYADHANLSLHPELFGPYFDPHGETLYDVGLTDTGFDWSTWDASIAEATAGGPMF